MVIRNGVSNNNLLEFKCFQQSTERNPGIVLNKETIQMERRRRGVKSAFSGKEVETPATKTKEMILKVNVAFPQR